MQKDWSLVKQLTNHKRYEQIMFRNSQSIASVLKSVSDSHNGNPIIHNNNVIRDLNVGTGTFISIPNLKKINYA